MITIAFLYILGQFGRIEFSSGIFIIFIIATLSYAYKTYNVHKLTFVIPIKPILLLYVVVACPAPKNPAIIDIKPSTIIPLFIAGNGGGGRQVYLIKYRLRSITHFINLQRGAILGP
jgi:hypothetical protein